MLCLIENDLLALNWVQAGHKAKMMVDKYSKRARHMPCSPKSGFSFGAPVPACKIPLLIGAFAVLRNLRLLLAAALLTGTAVCAQTVKSDQQSYTGVVEGAPAVATQPEKLFNDPVPEDGGWKGLARLLEALAPSADTSLPLTASQITDRIASMLDANQNEQALEIIQKRLLQVQDDHMPGTDVQLLFLHGRALAALERHQDAITVYRDMTVLYPELPEPWNNLAAEYVKQGKLAMAHDALTMALTADPHYSTARANLGEVLMLQAQQSFQKAGVSKP